MSSVTFSENNWEIPFRTSLYRCFGTMRDSEHGALLSTAPKKMISTSLFILSIDFINQILNYSSLRALKVQILSDSRNTKTALSNSFSITRNWKKLFCWINRFNIYNCFFLHENQSITLGDHDWKISTLRIFADGFIALSVGFRYSLPRSWILSEKDELITIRQ